MPQSYASLYVATQDLAELDTRHRAHSCCSQTVNRVVSLRILLKNFAFQDALFSGIGRILERGSGLLIDRILSLRKQQEGKGY